MEHELEKHVPETTVDISLEKQQTPTSERTARHLASAAFLDGFLVMSQPESSFANTRHYIQERIIDQDQAIDAIVEALDASRVRSEHDNRPIATLAFLGPTGVGKSEVAKVLAEFRSAEGEDAKLVKIDCSSFSQGHEVAKLTGSPPGYVSREQEPFLNSARIERLGTVVLFDEIEKGSPELYNLMLQIMEDGKLQLNNGETTSFRDTIIILTSNLGAQEMGERTREHPTGFGVSASPIDTVSLENTARKAFSDYFRPEFKNRIDSLVVFHPLSAEGLNKVLDVKLNAVNQEYEDEFGARLSLSDATRDHLVAKALEERHLGARPLIRAFKSEILSAFGQYIGSQSVEEGTHIRIFHRDEFPPEHPKDERQLIFASKRDGSIRRRIVHNIEPLFISGDEDFDKDGLEPTSSTEIVGPTNP